MEPFWFVISMLGLTFLIALVALLVLGPVLIMVNFWNPWLLLLLVFVAGGFWFAGQTVKIVRNLAWNQRHLSSYTLREHGIETTEWTAVGAHSPVRRTIPLESVTSVVASYLILRRIILTENGGGTMTETAPVLHVLFDQDGRRQIISVPFASHKDAGVDVWIEALRRRGVELGYTARPLSWKHEDYLSDEARLDYFASTEEVIPFPAVGGWLDNTISLENRWHKHLKQLQS